jgi:hypothetical protein
MTAWKHLVIIFGIVICTVIGLIVYGLFCGLGMGPVQESMIINTLFFPLIFIGHIMPSSSDFSNELSLLLVLIDIIFVISTVYFTILWGYRYFKKFLPSHRSNSLDEK